MTIEVTGYETDVSLFATRYKQGGRTVYSLVLSPNQIVNLFPAPDPSQPTPGNRRIRPAHAQGFAKYFRDNEDWVAPGILLRTPEPFDFEPLHEVAGTTFGIVKFPRRKLQEIFISDGQHRILGFHTAERQLRDDLNRAQNARAEARRLGDGQAAVAMADEQIKRIREQQDRLESERVSVEIYVEGDPKKFMQMFYDIADNQLGITASVKSRFDNRKVVNRSLETVLEHPLLKGRVDMEADRVGRGSPYLLGAKHVAEIVRSVQVGLDGRVSKIQERELSEADVARHAMEYFDLIVKAFPPLQQILQGAISPDDLRKSSLLGSVLMLRILAGVYHDLKDHAWTDSMIEEYFHSLAKHMPGPVYPGSIWMEHVDGSVFTEGGMAPHGRRQDLKTLKEAILTWALDRAPFVDDEPAPRPATEVEPDEDQHLSEDEADEILRPETAAARKKSKAAKAS